MQIMQNRKIARLLSLSSLAIVAVLTGCPSTNKGTSDFNFTGFSVESASKKIFVHFDKAVSGKAGDKPVANKIMVKKDSGALEAAKYKLSVESGKLVITLVDAITPSSTYTVELKAGAVKDTKGKTNTAKERTLAPNLPPPSLVANNLAFEASSKKKLKLTFTKEVEIADTSKIKVKLQAKGAGAFKDAKATIKMDSDKKIVLLTLSTDATSKDKYKVVLEAGAVRDKASQKVNHEEISSAEKAYSGS